MLSGFPLLAKRDEEGMEMVPSPANTWIVIRVFEREMLALLLLTWLPTQNIPFSLRSGAVFYWLWDQVRHIQEPPYCLAPVEYSPKQRSRNIGYSPNPGSLEPPPLFCWYLHDKKTTPLLPINKRSNIERESRKYHGQSSNSNQVTLEWAEWRTKRIQRLWCEREWYRLEDSGHVVCDQFLCASGCA